ncbi:helix-turn-helix domain-containing protein [Vagococcus zengguangii]|uniref:helix-turn-helix domain-containing protein n=1 Tax=Vagococcus zengguangii TaxID=2571750 RepID=UPI00110993B9|nr:helix-turn-helix transcriptional regulator [Vagococcus zengguangii]TLG79728.1 helix-turn-helix transcriptional regulator [Vagococcus zengguangii]
MRPIDNKEIGKRIKKIRTEFSPKKISLEAFGKLLNPPADKAAVSKWEKGAYLPNKARLEQIAQLGNVTLEYLLYGKQINGYGEKISKIRTNLDMTKFEFANVFKSSSNFHERVIEETISDWEDENLLPTFEQLEKIALLGETTVSEILWNVKEPDAVLSARKLEMLFDKESLDESQLIMREGSVSLFYGLRKILVERSSENLLNTLSHILLLYGIKDLKPELSKEELKKERQELITIITKYLEDEISTLETDK